VELTNARLRGKVSLAHPRFGTTSTHFHLLRQHWGESAWRDWCRAMAANQPFIEEGNSQVIQRVARGEALLGLTDSDDITAGQREGLKVRALHDFPETFSTPNTLARVRGSPNSSGALRLIQFLSSTTVENQLISAGGLEPNPPYNPRLGLSPDWKRLILDMESTSRQLEELFHR
jgi:ABC-type Fe3+ transport system substrate-binding protein